MQPSTIPSRYPRLSIIFIVTVGMSAIVHFNTMAHPFTLADNRHYMFYIFRILLRFKWVRYCAVPIYLACAWVTLTALGGPPTTSPLSGQESDSMEKTSSKRLSIAPPSSSPGSRPRKRKRTQENSDSTMLRYKAPRQLPTQMPGQHTSFLLVWLLATTLNLVGAPLVEPRYLIIPWLIWRLHMSSPRPEKQIVPPTLQGKPDGVGRNPYDIIKATLDAQHDHRLWLETAWFFVINGVTGYIFLSRGFEWPQEPGQVQRFMW